LNLSVSDPVVSLPPPQPREVDEAALHECVRDLVALSAMPACWIGGSPVFIAENVRDLMVSMLRPDTVYVRLHDRTHGKTHVATAHEKTASRADAKSGTLYRDVSSEPLLLDSEVALGLISLPIGRGGELGRVAVGSSRDHFPSRLELLLMQVAANQIAVALEYIELLARHERVEQELDRARNEAEKSSQVKSEFLAMMSHELRTPLNAIGGYVELIQDGIRGPLTPEQHTDLGRIRKSQLHLLAVIENVLGYLKLGSGKVTYDLRDVSVDDVVSNVEDITRPLVTSKQLEYRQSPAERGLSVLADYDKTQQIVLNLFSNAIKFTDPAGHLEITWAARDSAVRISVTDTGIGIPTDRLDSVFEPFVQVSSVRPRPAGGTGLGLSISRDFARGMGGQLFVESELGKGSTFTLVLPRARMRAH
jgi:signal transduction histidine kinase